MALPYKIEKLEDVSEGFRGEYKETDGGFILDVNGVVADDEVGGLKSALQKERSNAKTAAKEAERFKNEVSELRTERDELLDSSGTDAERQRIKDSYDRKIESAKRDHERENEQLSGRLKSRDTMIERLTADNRAEAMASRLAVDNDSRPILKKLIRERLRVTIDDEAEDPTLVILDSKGKETELKIEDLETEILADKTFARLVTDTKGGGGGGTRKQSRSTERTGSPDTRGKGGTRDERESRIAEKYGLEN